MSESERLDSLDSALSELAAQVAAIAAALPVAAAKAGTEPPAEASADAVDGSSDGHPDRVNLKTEAFRRAAEVGLRAAEKELALTWHEWGDYVGTTYKHRPAIEQVEVTAFDISEEPTYRHLSRKGHGASAEEFLYTYTDGYFTACAHASLQAAYEKADEKHKALFRDGLSRLGETTDYQRLRMVFLRMAKGEASAPEDRAFADLLRRRYFEAGTEHLGSDIATALHQEYRSSVLSALHAASAKRSASLYIAGGGKTLKDKDKDETRDKKKDTSK